MKKIVVLALCSTSMLMADFIISTAVTSTQTLTGEGAVGTITDTGSITVTGSNNGVTMNGGESDTGQQVINNGVISTVTGEAIYNPPGGDEATITNTGTIEVTGSSRHGIYNYMSDSCVMVNSGTITVGTDGNLMYNKESDSCTMTNNGRLQAFGGTGYGMYNLNGSANVMTNNGTIETLGSFGFGMNDGVSNSFTMTNNGTITTSGSAGHGMRFYASVSGVINNHGTVTITNTSANAIRCEETVSCRVNNTGVLRQEGSGGAAIYCYNDSSSVVNHSGTISTIQGSSDGVNSTGSSFQATSSGTISTTGSSANGIKSTGADAALTNSGTISTSGSSSHGVNSSGSSLHVTNSGTISTIGSSANGIRSTGADAALTNSGTISTSGDSSHGVNSTGSSLHMTNSGTISTTGSDAGGFYSTGANVVLTNSGTIKSAQSHAINFLGTNPTLILNQGSDIQGAVNSDNALNLTVENGIDLRLTIEEQNGFGNINISMPYVKIGNTETVATVNPTSFGVPSDMLEDLSDSILDDIYRNRDNYINCSFPGQGPWVEGIGTTRKRARTISTHNWQGGVLVGYDGRLGKENALGGFVGGSWGRGDVNSNAGTIATAPIQSYFGGLTFEQQYKWAFFSGALSAGYFQSNNQRTVFYNLAPNGQQTAKGKSGAGMLTTEIHAEMWLLKPYTFRPLVTATLRYAGLYLGSYTESGSSSNLSVNSRNISLIKPKLLLNLAISNRYHRCNPDNRPYNYEFIKVEYTLQPYVGIAGRFQVGGNTVGAQLLGASLSFNSTAPKNLGELLFGISGNVVVEGSWSLFFNAEGLVDNERSSRFLGDGGFSYTF